jgi:zinc transporter, ZIP family
VSYDANVFTVLVAASVTALATGLGALPFLFVPGMKRSALGVSNALAAGAMLGASAGLAYEGAARGPARTAVGAVLGVGAIVASRRLLGHEREVHVGRLRGADARRALMIIGIMTVHSFTEGVGVGVSFGDGEAFGLFVALAIAVHNVPEGLAISLVLVPRGASVASAAGWSVFSSLPQPLMAVPAFLFVETFEPLLPAGLGFAAGAMLWMVAAELLPDAVKDASTTVVAGVTLLAAGAMIGLQIILL